MERENATLSRIERYAMRIIGLVFISQRGVTDALPSFKRVTFNNREKIMDAHEKTCTRLNHSLLNAKNNIFLSELHDFISIYY